VYLCVGYLQLLWFGLGSWKKWCYYTQEFGPSWINIVLANLSIFCRSSGLDDACDERAAPTIVAKSMPDRELSTRQSA